MTKPGNATAKAGQVCGAALCATHAHRAGSEHLCGPHARLVLRQALELKEKT